VTGPEIIGTILLVIWGIYIITIICLFIRDKKRLKLKGWTAKRGDVFVVDMTDGGWVKLIKKDDDKV